jgi:hypothetical protein
MEHRSQFFHYNWVDHLNLRLATLQVCPPDSELSLWRNDFRAMESMFIERAPAFDVILETLRSIEAQFRTDTG